jgi:hypothetical protein
LRKCVSDARQTPGERLRTYRSRVDPVRGLPTMNRYGAGLDAIDPNVLRCYANARKNRQ